jgi:hypothetical protein
LLFSQETKSIFDPSPDISMKILNSVMCLDFIEVVAIVFSDGATLDLTTLSECRPNRAHFDVSGAPTSLGSLSTSFR